MQAAARVVSVGPVAWATACDGHAAMKISAGTQRDPRILTEQASRAARAIRAASVAAGEAFAQAIVEFVDDAGGVVHTSRFTDAQLAGAPIPAPIAGGPSAPPDAGTHAGHRPIPGLATPRIDAGIGVGASASIGGGGLAHVRHAIAVGAGKGGVGKSTIAVNLAVALARRGHAVGILDGDIYGPSLPTLLGLGALEQSVVAGMLQPYLVHGVKAITIGKLVDADKPLIWRGPMAHGAFKQLAEQTQWGDLDYLIIDLPPGTGDVSLTMAQSIRLTGAVVVCTPQKVAQDDAVRAAKMFQQLNIDVLGVVENMSTFIADDLDPPREYDLFGRGGAEQMAQRLGLPFLGAVPLTIALRKNSDAGEPTRNFDAGARGETALARALEALATNLEGQVGLASLRQGRATPTLTIS